MRRLDHAVEGDVGRVDDLAHGARGCHGLVPGIRSDLVLLDRTNLRPAVTCWSRSSATPASRCTGRSRRRCATPSGPGGCARGTSLPPTRGLARELGVSRGVVVEAYQQLVAEGYLTSRPGGYTRVAIGPEPPRRRAAADPPQRAEIDFCPCRADGSQFPRAAWLRSMRRVLTEASDERLRLREPPRRAGAARRARRVPQPRARHVGQAGRDRDLQRLRAGHRARRAVLATAGAKRLAVEDPSADDDAVPARPRGRPRGRRRAGRRGRHPRRRARRAPTPTRSCSRRRTSGRPARSSRPTRRAAVLRWAQRARRARHRGRLRRRVPLRPRADRRDAGPRARPRDLRGHREQDARARSAARLARRPAALVDDVAEAKTLADRGSPVLDQLAFADFLVARRVRPPPAPHAAALPAPPRRAARARSRASSPSSSRPGSPPACTSSPTCPTISTRRRWSRPPRARRRALRPRALPRRPPGRPGLIFGYATLSERAITDGVEILAEAIRRAGRPPSISVLMMP